MVVELTGRAKAKLRDQYLQLAYFSNLKFSRES